MNRFGFIYLAAGNHTAPVTKESGESETENATCLFVFVALLFCLL